MYIYRYKLERTRSQKTILTNVINTCEDMDSLFFIHQNTTDTKDIYAYTYTYIDIHFHIFIYR